MCFSETQRHRDTDIPKEMHTCLHTEPGTFLTGVQCVPEGKKVST